MDGSQKQFTPRVFFVNNFSLQELFLPHRTYFLSCNGRHHPEWRVCVSCLDCHIYIEYKIQAPLKVPHVLCDKNIPSNLFQNYTISLYCFSKSPILVKKNPWICHLTQLISQANTIHCKSKKIFIMNFNYKNIYPKILVIFHASIYW